MHANPSRLFEIEFSSDEEIDSPISDSQSSEVLIIDDQMFNVLALQGQLKQLRIASNYALSGEKAF